ncbi:hypothetical protein MCANUFG1_00045 [Mycoplasmopsis canis UFG1]|uniref:hypothetical protein n=1 Tax=Mycoplasmopsis canis TaxID=29555 RepID=UPI00025B05EB|nr:hypothetical protein [Mycoplasmopsis canis]EIE42260.1 hypothetical protein MCANUFG1_00045 [Mycoplasmopsis canis UFG1]
MKLDVIKLVTEPVSVVSPSMGQIQQDNEMELIKNLKQEIIKNSNNDIIKTLASSDRNVELVDIFYKKTIDTLLNYINTQKLVKEIVLILL